MNAGRSRLALIGILALAVCLTAGLVAGSADAKKKKKKGGNSVTLSQATPTAIPAGDGTNQVAGVGTDTFTVGKKKGKGKVVAPNSLTATYQLTDPGGSLDDLDIKVVAPDGTTVFLDNPAFLFGDSDITTVAAAERMPQRGPGQHAGPTMGGHGAEPRPGVLQRRPGAWDLAGQGRELQHHVKPRAEHGEHPHEPDRSAEVGVERRPCREGRLRAALSFFTPLLAPHSRVEVAETRRFAGRSMRVGPGYIRRLSGVAPAHLTGR